MKFVNNPEKQKKSDQRDPMKKMLVKMMTHVMWQKKKEPEWVSSNLFMPSVRSVVCVKGARPIVVVGRGQDKASAKNILSVKKTLTF